MRDIYDRLKSARADMLGTDDEQHYWDCHEAADVIARLRAEINRLQAREADATATTQSPPGAANKSRSRP